jgi:hypothetical protein
VIANGGKPITPNGEIKMKTWNITLPNGAKMTARMDEGKADQVNTNGGSFPLAVWLDGLQKIKAAGGVIVES